MICPRFDPWCGGASASDGVFHQACLSGITPVIRVSLLLAIDKLLVSHNLHMRPLSVGLLGELSHHISIRLLQFSQLQIASLFVEKLLFRQGMHHPRCHLALLLLSTFNQRLCCVKHGIC